MFLVVAMVTLHVSESVKGTLFILVLKIKNFFLRRVLMNCIHIELSSVLTNNPSSNKICHNTMIS